MMNRDKTQKQSNINENEPSRRPSGQSGYGSSSGRSGSPGKGEHIDVNKGSTRRGNSGSMENERSSSGSE